jgi:thiamine-monophosphate kinase
VDEFDLIQRYFRRPAPGVAVGIGDDGAIVGLPPGHELVVVVDTLVAGVHFPDDITAEDVGYRALAVNLSDIAAMGAEPAWMTLALTLPEADAAWLDGFAAGLFGLADRYGVSLIGGDTTRGPLTVTVEVLGHLPAGLRLLRGGARAGDVLFVSGTLGDAAAGLADVDAKHAAARQLRHRFLRPEPRVGLGLTLAGRATAAIDISDGLLADLGHVCRASGVGAVVETERLPLSAALLECVGFEQALRYALHGGDDYELCLTLPPDADLDEPEITRIGTITAEPGIRLLADGRFTEVAADGYRHFGDAP